MQGFPDQSHFYVFTKAISLPPFLETMAPPRQRNSKHKKHGGASNTEHQRQVSPHSIWHMARRARLCCSPRAVCCLVVLAALCVFLFCLCFTYFVYVRPAVLAQLREGRSLEDAISAGHRALGAELRAKSAGRHRASEFEERAKSATHQTLVAELAAWSSSRVYGV